MENTALQITNFNFYGDELIALKDNATGEIYTSINHVLKGIGFSDDEQIRRRRDKWKNDLVIGKGVVKLRHPSDGGQQDTYCISQRKLPLALAKINITPKMKKTQPEISSRLELYQDKCADVLASVFIDHQLNGFYMAPFIESIKSLTKTVEKLEENMDTLKHDIQDLKDSQTDLYPIRRKHQSAWYKKMRSKYKMLSEYFGCSVNELYSSIYKELEDAFDIDIDQVYEDYCNRNHLKKNECYRMDAIENNQKLKNATTSLINTSLVKYGLQTEDEVMNTKRKTLFNVMPKGSRQWK